MFQTYKEVRDICVRNIPKDSTEDDLRNFFYSCGMIKKLRLLPNSNGDDSKHAFVTFEEMQSAMNAVAYKQNSLLNGSPVQVQWSSRPKKPWTNPGSPKPESTNSTEGSNSGNDSMESPFKKTIHSPTKWKCRDLNCSYLNNLELQNCSKCNLDRSLAQAAVRNRVVKLSENSQSSKSSKSSQQSKSAQTIKLPTPALPNQPKPPLIIEDSKGNECENGSEGQRNETKDKNNANNKPPLRQILKRERFNQHFDIDSKLGSLVQLLRERAGDFLSDDIPAEDIYDHLSKSRDPLALDLSQLESRLKSSFDFYETCQNMHDSASEVTKVPFRTSLDGAIEGVRVTVNDLLSNVHEDYVRSFENEGKRLLTTLKATTPTDVTTADGTITIEQVEEIMKGLEICIQKASDKEAQEPIEPVRKLIESFQTAIDVLSNPTGTTKELMLFSCSIADALKAVQDEKPQTLNPATKPGRGPLQSKECQPFKSEVIEIMQGVQKQIIRLKLFRQDILKIAEIIRESQGVTIITNLEVEGEAQAEEEVENKVNTEEESDNDL